MRKVFLNTVLGFFIVAMHIVKDTFSVTEIYLKTYACNLDINPYLNKIKNSDSYPFFNEIKAEELKVIDDLKQELCTKNKLIKVKI